MISQMVQSLIPTTCVFYVPAVTMVRWHSSRSVKYDEQLRNNANRLYEIAQKNLIAPLDLESQKDYQSRISLGIEAAKVHVEIVKTIENDPELYVNLVHRISDFPKDFVGPWSRVK